MCICKNLYLDGGTKLILLAHLLFTQMIIFIYEITALFVACHPIKNQRFRVMSRAVSRGYTWGSLAGTND